MIRRLFVLAALAAVLGLAAFWFLTVPATVPASALPPHTANLANGTELFYVGGCASCHAVPKQPDMTKLGGGLALTSLRLLACLSSVRTTRDCRGRR